jgi:hypothetical protein
VAITFVAAAKSPTSFPGSTNNISTCVITKPTGTANGDVMIAFLESGNDTISAPAGWTLVEHKLYAAGNMVSAVWWKVAASEGASYTFTDDSADSTPLEGAIVTYRGVSTSAPVNVQTSSTTTGTDVGSTPAATTTANCLMLHYRSGKTSTVSSAGTFAVTGLTNRFSVANRGGSTQYFSELYDSGTVVGVGSQLGKSFDASLTMSGSIERQIGLKDAVTVVSGADTTPAAQDTATVSATAVAADTASGADVAQLAVAIITADTGSTLDVATVRVYDGDTSTGTEDVKVVADGATLGFGQDSATAVEAATVGIRTDEPATALDLTFIGYQGRMPRGPRIKRIYPGDG